MNNGRFTAPTLLILTLFALAADPVAAQQIIPASVSFTKEWGDSNGRNTLTVRGANLCNPDHEYGARDGHPSRVEVTLTNDRYSVYLADSLSFDEYQMSSMLIREAEIRTVPFRGVEIVIVPVNYCANYDMDMRVSYLVLYNGRMWSFDVRYLHEIEGRETITLNDDLETRLDVVRPKRLKRAIMQAIIEHKPLNP